jgi:hypothetical protein
MRTTRRTGVIVALAAAACGCLGPTTPEQSRQRFVDASRMPPGSARDQQMKWVALDASDTRNVVIAERAVRAIENPRLRDDVAESSATRLSQAGAADFAARVATLIGDPARRDRVLDQVLNPPKR